jgi:hypothetical protein
MITGGAGESSDGSVWRVPKRDLIVGLQVAFQKRWLEVARGCAEATSFREELLEMRMRVSSVGDERYGGRGHDDLVLAWWRIRRCGLGWRFRGELFEGVVVRISFRRSVVKCELRHRVVLSVTRPQPCAACDRSCGDERVTQFDGVAFSVTLQVFSGPPADCGVGRDTHECIEQSFKSPVFGGTGPSPNFGCGYVREEDESVGFTQFHPPGYNGGVAASRNFDQDV